MNSSSVDGKPELQSVQYCNYLPPGLGGQHTWLLLPMTSKCGSNPLAPPGNTYLKGRISTDDLLTAIVAVSQ